MLHHGIHNWLHPAAQCRDPGGVQCCVLGVSQLPASCVADMRPVTKFIIGAADTSVHARIDQTHVFRRRVLADAVAEIEHMARVAPVGVAAVRSCRGRARLQARISSGANSTYGSRLPWSATRSPTRARAWPRFTVQSTPTTSVSLAAISSSHRPPPLVKTMHGMRSPCVLPLDLLQHALRVSEAEALEGTVREDAAPGVEHHHGLRAGLRSVFG